MKGTIKWFKREKGFGFITGEDNKDYFVHSTALPQGQDDIKESDEIKVSFDAKDTDRGVQAQNVVLEENDASTDDEDSE